MPQVKFYIDKIIFDEKVCANCAACLLESECGGIFFREGKIFVDTSKPEDWKLIAEVCPTGALVLVARD